RGITVGPGGAWFLTRSTTTITVPSRITGSGSLSVAKESSTLTLSNPANDWAGDTVLGSESKGWWNNAASLGWLILGADEVIPDGAGKGRLVFLGDKRGRLDLNGHAETVNSLVASNGLSLVNSAAQPAVLTAGGDNADMRLSGEIGAGATLQKTGTGSISFWANAASAGGLRLSGGPLEFSSGDSFGGLTLTLDGGSLRVTDWLPGLTERKTAANSFDPAAPLAFNAVRLTTEKGLRGITAVEFGDYTQYGYSGRWYVPTAGTYSFAKSFDDAAALYLDGQLVLNNGGSSSLAVKQGVEVAAGWHTVDIRFWNGGGIAGVYSAHTWAPAGIMFDPDNGPFPPADEAAVHAFADPGDGSVLRTTPLGSSTNTVTARLELAQSGTLDRSGAAASPLVWAGDLVTAAGAAGTPVLTVAGGTGPFIFGATNRSPVFDADIADVNGVVFQNLAWIKAWPASSTHTIQPGAELAAGAPGVLGAGPLTLTDWNARIPSAGTLITDVAVPDGRVVRFDATRETGGRLTNDTAYAFTADNAVTLGGGNAAVAFDGAGTVTYTGTVSGNGRLVKSGLSGTAVLTGASTFTGTIEAGGGRLLIGSDAALGDAANTVSLTGGLLGNASGAPLTLARSIVAQAGGGIEATAEGGDLTLTGPLSGTMSKAGDGLLTLGGAAANLLLDLAVDEGTAVLDKEGAPAVRSVVRVASNATVRLAGSGGNQIAQSVALSGGTLDMNGRSEWVAKFEGTRNVYSSRVTNSSMTPATLTANDAGVFQGSLSDGAGRLSFIKTGNNSTQWLFGGSLPQTYTGETRLEGGTLNWGLSTRYVRMTILRARGAASWPSLAEFRVLRDGEWLPLTGVTATADSQADAARTAEKLIDNNMETSWMASNGNSGHWLKLDFGQPTAMTGYAWYTRDADSSSDPVSWRIEVSQDNTNWHVADEQTNATITGTRRVLAGIWPFNNPLAGGCSASAGSAVTLATDTTATVFSPHETFAALAGGGTLTASAGTVLRVNDLSGFTGHLRGGGRLEVGGAGGETPPLKGIPPGLAIANAGNAPLTVVAGASSGVFGAALHDGEFPAGLTKRGNSAVTVVGVGSDYTGDTRVEAGTLTVVAGSASYRYVRFSTSEVRDPNGNNNSGRISLGEFQLVSGDVPVTLPPGTTATALQSLDGYGPEKAIDGNWTVASGRWIGVGHGNWLKLDMKGPVAFTGYQFYTAMDSAYDWSRDPVSWTFEASEDGENWTLLDSHVQDVY
ncbi:MAG: discoidin domain-containing protein, partial [Verrucomicrobiota bacterium]|nr:discoidin domain-containing protein [Verrucomicrobiota bacterium]